MFIKMCQVVSATRSAGNALRVVRGTTFSSFCTNSPPRFRLLGPPEIHKWYGSNNSYDARNHLLNHPPPSSDTKRDFDLRIVESPHPVLELFININQIFKKSRDHFYFFFDNSWNHDSLTTLKIIGYMKQHSNTLGEGRERFYIAALWLHSHHPMTLAKNVRVFSNLGCLKDWLEILHRLVTGSLARSMERHEIKRGRRERVLKLLAKRSGEDHEQHDLRNKENDHYKGNEFLSREEKRIRMARQAVEMYNSDPNYRFLYDQVCDLYAELLKSDLEFLNSGDYAKLSLASKWCPSIDSSYDRSTLFCESVARRLFPYDSNPEYKGIEEAHYAHRVRHCLQKQVLVPLRRALKLPEVYIGSNQWNLIPYDRVSINAMTTNKRSFMKHDKDRFLKYFHPDEKKNRGKQKLGTGREMFPHDIYRLLDWGYDADIVDAKWKNMVQAFSEEGKFQNCIVAFQYTEMEDLPKLVQRFAFSFQLLASDLSESPWKGNIFRQREDSDEYVVEFSKIRGDDLRSKMESLKSLYTRTRSVRVSVLFDTILKTAVRYNVSKEKMVRRIYLFGNHDSLMFIHAGDTYAEIEICRKKFEDSGYEMPDLVYWYMPCIYHLKKWDFRIHTRGFSTVKFCKYGIMGITGLSTRCIQVFLEEDGKVDPKTVMDSQFSAQEYMEFKVHD